jgi:hypothetical protein
MRKLKPGTRVVINDPSSPDHGRTGIVVSKANRDDKSYYVHDSTGSLIKLLKERSKLFRAPKK